MLSCRCVKCSGTMPRCVCSQLSMRCCRTPWEFESLAGGEVLFDRGKVLSEGGLVGSAAASKASCQMSPCSGWQAGTYTRGTVCDTPCSSAVVSKGAMRTLCICNEPSARRLLSMLWRRWFGWGACRTAGSCGNAPPCSLRAREAGIGRVEVELESVSFLCPREVHRLPAQAAPRVRCRPRQLAPALQS